MPTIAKRRINHLFREGYRDFNAGLPIPTNRIKAMGWRQGKSEKQSYTASLNAAYELFEDLDNKSQDF